jgi:Mycothiol maleylpyruvate isomerase N-terminal domain
MPDLRYPIGPFVAGAPPDANERLRLLSDLAAAPDRLRAAVADLSENQMDTPYRPGGWTVRQVVHHPDELVYPMREPRPLNPPSSFSMPQCPCTHGMPATTPPT